MYIMKKMLLAFLLFIGFALLGLAPTARAQEYILEVGDRISVTFWQDPTLNTEATIDADGKIALPVIGQMTSAGLTISQLSAKIAEKMSLFNPRVTQALVRVLEYGSKRLYITGAVQMPGPKTFERMPNV
ncbi:MAG: hypothetical protein D6814_06810, partial [Calditrichaeota bacterium]